MASRTDVLALEEDCPWLRDDFRAGLQALSASTADGARRFAADMQVLAALATLVPRCPFDDRGATPWTSFRREVAVARTISDRAAADEIATARLLAEVLPATRALLEAGAVTVPRARAFITEVGRYDDALGRSIDAELAARVPGLPPWRIVQEVRRAADRMDAEAAVLRTAAANAGRGVRLQPDADDQASVWLTGPAVPLTRWYGTVDAQARTLKQAGDPRTLDQLRFDLATGTFPCSSHAPAEPYPTGVELAAAGTRAAFVEAAPTDCRRSRPVQAHVTVPVETALGLSNEPAWLDGYGWLSGPTTRLLLADAELQRVCVQDGTGQLVGVAGPVVRPAPTPTGLRQSLLHMVLDPIVLSEVGSRWESAHDPSPPLRDLVVLRDRFCDGPTGARAPARTAELDHDTAWPNGPTAAWNLVARATRTHQLKHYGWTPLRTPTSTIWFSPAGQVVEVPRHHVGPPGVDDGDGPVVLPDPDELAALDERQLRPHGRDDSRPWLPASERDAPEWTWLQDDPSPF